MHKIRVVIADDSSLARALLREFLEAQEDIEVVGEAGDGRQAVELARRLKPDLITMDLEMPVMNGLEAIEEIMCSKAVPILVVSSVADGQNALEAVSRGALEVVGKPDCSPSEAADFVQRVRLLSGLSVITRFRPRKAMPVGDETAGVRTPVAPTLPVTSRLQAEADGYTRVFAVACSTGGPQALAQILPILPAGFACPVLVAQHISDGFASGMVAWLASLCALPVRLAVEGETLAPGVIYVSPSERHLCVSPARRLALGERRAQDVFHPSCDVMLESVAQVYGKRAVGVILTGMSSDGARGMACIHERGGVTLAQDEATSVIYGMNRVAIESGVIDQVLPVEAIAAAMVRLAQGEGRT